MMDAKWLLLILASAAALVRAVRHDAVAFMPALSPGRPSRSRRIETPSSSDLNQLRQGRAKTQTRSSSTTTTTRMSQLRTFEASELQLQRFIGELGFVEITDWCVNVCLFWLGNMCDRPSFPPAGDRMEGPPVFAPVHCCALRKHTTLYRA